MLGSNLGSRNSSPVKTMLRASYIEYALGHLDIVYRKLLRSEVKWDRGKGSLSAISRIPSDAGYGRCCETLT